MKVAVICTVGLPAKYGGFETLVENLVRMKSREDVEYTVYCSSRSYPEKLKEYHGARLKYIPFKANGWQSLIYDNISLLHAYFTSDVILSLGGNNLLHPILRLFAKRTVINNFDGLDFRREKWGWLARNTIKFTGKVTARYADICIADNEVIREFIKERYGRESELIEYGGDNAFSVVNDGTLEKEYGLKAGGYYFKVARIEPENNIEMILEAFSQIPDRQLVVVGNWNYSNFGIELRERYMESGNIKMLDPIYDQNKLNQLRSNCAWYVHGHSVGGTNPSLVEAMSLGLSIMTFDVSYNRATTEDKALYFRDAKSLKSFVERDGDDLRNGMDMKEIADRKYRWSVIAEKYEKLYSKLIR